MSHWPAKTFDPSLVQDKKLSSKLRAEYPGILAWMVRGCLDWQRGGLTMPEKVKMATAAYRQGEDLLASWLDECCTRGDSAYRCRASALYASFHKWCENGGEPPLSQTLFGESLVKRGYERFTSNGVWYRGVALCQTGEPDD